MNKFGNMLKYYRKKHGLSQEALSEKIGIPRSTLSNYEQGRREPDFETEEHIADFFNIDINTLRGITVPDFTDADKEFLNTYKQLDDNTKARLLAYAQGLLDLQKGRD